MECNTATETVQEPATATKRCPKCGVVKPHDDFYKNSHRTNGLSSYCKECTSKRNKRRYRAGGKAAQKKRIKDKAVKRCVRCDKVKAQSEYAPDITSEDGRQDVCSDCIAIYARYSECEPDTEEQIKSKVRLVGKYVGRQLVSIVREMALLQDAINRERDQHDIHVSEEQDRTESFLRRAVGRQIILERLLRAIFSKGTVQGDNMLACEYGYVRYVDGRLRVGLHPDVARLHSDKP